MTREKGNHPLFYWEEVQWGGVITLEDGSHHDVVEKQGSYITLRDEKGFISAHHMNHKLFWNARYTG